MFAHLILVACAGAAQLAQAGDWKRGKYGSRPDFLGQVKDMPFEVTHFNHQHLPKQYSKHKMPGAQSSGHAQANCSLVALQLDLGRPAVPSTPDTTETNCKCRYLCEQWHV